MRDKPQEALHFGFWRAKQQPPQQRGRRLAAAAVFLPSKDDVLREACWTRFDPFSGRPQRL